jgi:tRNA1(Val) A37 N6-methylase TrmN6
MRSCYPLFQSHLDLAHWYWAKLITPGDCIIDATCGNGKDTLQLAELAIQIGMGKVYAFDIQKEAIESAKKYLFEHLAVDQMQRVEFILGSHTQFPDTILSQSVKLIVYNLGYLPGGNKAQTTLAETTLTSLKAAQTLIAPGGAISIMCYPGHPAGQIEEEALLAFAEHLPKSEWSCCHHRWLNRLKSPSLLLLQRAC